MAALLALAVFAAAPAAAETIRVSVDKATFTPAQIAAKVGDIVEWVSTDIVAHTATARDKQWDVMIPAKNTGRLALKKAGEVEYYCRFHPNMVGRISVQEK